MKDQIATRLELCLAKIAGRDVDISTMTPPVAADMVEKLLLEIANRLNGIACGATASADGLMSKADKSKLDGIAAGAQVNPGAATTSNAGIVKMAANVSDAAGSAPTAEEFNALLSALVSAGIMAAPESNDNQG